MDSMRGALLGPAYSEEEARRALDAAGAVYDVLPDDAALFDRTARLLADGRAVGWFQGRMEFGPRALGSRSILADPRLSDMQHRLNLKIKFRESFRPFAPSVLAEDAAEYFDAGGGEGGAENPYMLFVWPVRADKRCREPGRAEERGLGSLDQARSVIPAVTHVDFTARAQTVDARRSPRFHGLLKRFKELTGCPVLVNTSFNVRGEPIVCAPAEAWRCFMATDLDALVLERCVLLKERQPEAAARAARHDRLDIAPD
jgi:carbamoyltransferase